MKLKTCFNFYFIFFWGGGGGEGGREEMVGRNRFIFSKIKLNFRVGREF